MTDQCSPAQSSPGVDGLRRHAKQRTADARQRIEKAIRELRKQQAVINVNSVARAACVTRKTIYNQPDLLQRIRTQPPVRVTAAPPPSTPAGQETSIVTALRRELTSQQTRYRTQLAELRATLQQTQEALAIAHAELHRLNQQQSTGASQRPKDRRY